MTTQATRTSWRGSSKSRLHLDLISQQLAEGGALLTRGDGTMDYIATDKLYDFKSSLSVELELIRENLRGQGADYSWPTYKFRGYTIRGVKPKHDMFLLLRDFGSCTLTFVKHTNQILEAKPPVLDAKALQRLIKLYSDSRSHS